MHLTHILVILEPRCAALDSGVQLRPPLGDLSVRQGLPNRIYQSLWCKTDPNRSTTFTLAPIFREASITNIIMHNITITIISWPVAQSTLLQFSSGGFVINFLP